MSENKWREVYIVESPSLGELILETCELASDLFNDEKELHGEKAKLTKFIEYEALTEAQERIEQLEKKNEIYRKALSRLSDPWDIEIEYCKLARQALKDVGEV